MDFNDTPQEAEFRAQVRAWIDANAPQYLKEYLESSAIGVHLPDEFNVLEESKKWQLTKAKAGWACLAWPKEYGGRDATPIQNVIWRQEEGIFNKLSNAFFIGQGMCGPTVMTHATEEQKTRYLPKLASGEEVWCQMFSEPQGGSDLAGLRTRAVKDGDDWVINGQKIWTSVAHFSDYGILITRTDPSVAKHKGLTMFFVDMKSPGIEIRPIKQANGASDFNEVYFDDLRIPDAQRLGGAGDGWRVSLTTLMNERMAIGGGIDTGYDDFREFIQSLIWAGGSAMDDSAVRAKFADWHCKAMGLRNTSWRSLTALSKGEAPGPESSISKLVAGVMAQEMSKYALDLQGFGGVLVDQDSASQGGIFQSRMLRSPAIRVEGGTDQILRNIIAERVLGLPEGMRADKGVPFNEIPTGN